MNKFNKCLAEFLDVLKQNYPGQKESIEKYYSNLRKSDGDGVDDGVDADATIRYICGRRFVDEYIANCKGKGDELSTKNEIIFSRNSVLLHSVDLYSIWNDEGLLDSQRENIWKYLHTLYLYGVECQLDKDFKTVHRGIKDAIKRGKTLNEKEKTFMNIIDAISREKKIEKELDNGADDSDDNDDADGMGSAFGDIGEDMKELFESIGSHIFDGQIGTLAKEIMDEIDLDKLKLTDPIGFVKNIISGNMNGLDGNPEFASVVKNIVSKLQAKLESGAIDKDKLMQETQAVFEKFQKMGFDDSDGEEDTENGGGKKKKNKKKKNPIMNMMSNMMKKAGKGSVNEGDLSDLMKKMGGSAEDMELFTTMMKEMGGSGGLNNMAKAMGLGSGGRMSNRMSQRDRLKKKLEERNEQK